MKRVLPALLAFLLLFSLLLGGCSLLSSNTDAAYIDLDSLPDYAGEAYVPLLGNQPGFDDADLKRSVFESYSPLDLLDRCGPAFALVGVETMPTENRGSIGQIKPSGWQTVKYDFVDGKYLYNRCHLIGFQLTGENANQENLITGTRYLNVQGMLPFENMVADYVKESGNHVLYRATPIFRDSELLARGVQLEALSVEDAGEGICFNVYCYNVQPGVVIDYATGDNWAADSAASDEDAAMSYILNTRSKKFHLPDCPGAADIKAENRQVYSGSRSILIAQGYSPCGRCEP